jgi:hypothetical protein
MRAGPHPRSPRFARRGSVLLVVLVMLLFTAGILTTFIDKASTDLIVEARRIRADRLRSEAYSALEVTLAVLNEFVLADANALRSPQEGWNDPLAFAGWEPEEGHTVTVAFEDESGKIPLANVDATTLNTLFKAWEMSDTDAQEMTDAILSWTKTNYTPTSTYQATYDQGDLPYAAPRRSMLSFNELAAIDLAAKFFYDENGRPNAYWHRFVDTFSLYTFTQPNINAFPIHPDVLTAYGKFEPEVQQKLSDYLAGAGNYEGGGPKYFKVRNDANPVIGTGGNLNNFNTFIRALRVHVTVHEGDAQYRLTAMIAPPNGATTVQSTATNNPTAASNAGAGTNTVAAGTGAAQGQGQQGRGAVGANANNGRAGAAANGRGGAAAGTGRGGTGATGAAANSTTSLRYPFTVLEIRENYDPPQLSAPTSTEDEAAPVTAAIKTREE